MITQELSAKWLGQSGARLVFGGTIVYTDPYLSHCVEKAEGAQARRLRPIDTAPVEIRDASWILISHLHLDHCDPETLLPLLEASPRARVMGPAGVIAHLQSLGVAADRLITAKEDWFRLSPDLKVIAVPACHPTISRDGDGQLECVGYVLDWNGRRIYFAGDTSPVEELITALKGLAPIHTALLPVNERNYFRDQRGILGNMSLREAFELASETGIQSVVPIHWDMFRLNRVHREEIELLYRLEYENMKPPFTLRIEPETL